MSDIRTDRLPAAGRDLLAYPRATPTARGRADLGDDLPRGPGPLPPPRERARARGARRPPLRGVERLRDGAPGSICPPAAPGGAPRPAEPPRGRLRAPTGARVDHARRGLG